MSRPVAEANAWGRSLHFWARTTLVYMMIITVTGAVVRLTGSGLGCTDWPTCETNEALDAPAFHATIEFGNRIVSGLAVLPVIGAALAARRGGRRDLRPWFIALLAGFAGQVILGMVVTRTELDPRVVLGHFLLSIVLIFIGVVIDRRSLERPDAFSAPASDRPVALVLVAATAVLVVLGTLVTGSGPHTGSDGSGEAVARLGFDVREITRIHSIAAWLVVAVVVAGAWRLFRSGQRSRSLEIIAAIALIQGGIGYIQYFTGVPVVLVGLHIAGAVLLWTAVVAHAVAPQGPLLSVGSGSPRAAELVP